MKSSAIRRVIILGAIAIAGILFLQAYWFRKNWNQSDKEFHQTVNIALLNVARSMAEFNGSTLPITDVVKRMSSNYYVVNFNDIIDANVLEYYLLKEFETLQLNTDFEYAIYDCSSDEMLYGNYCNIVDMEPREERSDNLPTYDEFIYYFGVKFPSITHFLIGDMSLAIVFSIITLTALIFFIYSIFVILKQKRLSELQRDFINNMTHEFKTPISSIKISNDVLRQSDVVRSDPRLSQYATIISQQNDRLDAQVEKVLSIARLDENFNLVKESLDLHDIIAEVSKSKELEIHKKQGQIQLNLDAEHHVVEADKLHLTNVLYNLLDNAVKYTRISPVIIIQTKNEHDSLKLTVKDNGIGIPKEHLKNLFKKFFRVPTGNVHDVKGFGLGLHYVKRIIDKHHWKIEVSSQPERGTEMHVTIPSTT